MKEIITVITWTFSWKTYTGISNQQAILRPLLHSHYISKLVCRSNLFFIHCPFKFNSKFSSTIKLKKKIIESRQQLMVYKNWNGIGWVLLPFLVTLWCNRNETCPISPEPPINYRLQIFIAQNFKVNCINNPMASLYITIAFKYNIRLS